jgi:hypothetical protein
MSPRSATRTAAAIGGVLVAVCVWAGPALAAPIPAIPADVQASYAGPALRFAQAGAEGVSADFSGAVRAGDIRQVFTFSADFVDGVATTEPVVPTDGWLAGIVRGDAVLGTLLVRKPDGGPAEPSGFSSDVALGSVLEELTATEVLIEDPPSGSFFAWNGTTVRPLNHWARDALPAPADISDLQDVVAAQAAARAAGEADADGSSGLGVSLIAVGAALAVAGGLVVLWRRPRRGSVRPAP